MLLEALDLRISYGNLEAVHGVSFSVRAGELVSIIGANGAGKSSILNGIMGLLRPRSGEILLDGRRLTGLPAHQRARMGLRLVPERGVVFPLLTVRENLMVGLYGQKRKVKVQERLEWIYGLFPVLEERSTQQARTLSGGEQQQLAIARALVSSPRVLLVDEVSMGLMPKLVTRVFEALQRLNMEYGLTILLVEQNALASLRISHRAYVLETGELALQGTAHELIQDERVRRAYLGL
ncbi:MAG: ABC transporter ATP-binding protein [Thermodesulfobacteriota bacterium]